MGRLGGWRDCEWERWRGHSLSSVTTKKDYAQFAAMLKRTRNDKAFTLEALQHASSNFLSSNKPFDKRQGFAYLCVNIARYMIGNSNIDYKKGPDKRYVPKDTENDWTMDELEWWKG